MRRALWACVALLWILVVGNASAEEPPQPAVPEQAETPEAREYKRHLDLGLRLFEDRNYDAAIAEFELAYKMQARASPLINIALCHKGRFEYVKAIAMLERALREHADTAGDPASLEKAIAEMRELLGRVELNITPRVATPRLTLDGEELPPDHATKTFGVSPGKHVLVVSADGYADARREFRMASGELLSLDVALDPDEGKLVFSSIGGDARVWIDGELQGPGKLTLRLKPGTHLLEAERGDARYSASFAIVPGETTPIVLDKDGLLRVGKAPPRGPDVVALPPVSGPYVLLLVDVGPRLSESNDIRVAPGARLGYRITSGVGIEAEFQQVFNVVQSTDRDEIVGTSVARLNARLMMSTLPVRFVTTLGLGYAHDFDDTGSGNGFNALVEPAVELELSNVIVSLATPVVVGVTSLKDGTLSFDFGGGLRVGYGFW